MQRRNHVPFSSKVMRKAIYACSRLKNKFCKNLFEENERKLWRQQNLRVSLWGDDIGPGTKPSLSMVKSSLSMVKCLLLFILFCWDEISSRDELIPSKRQGWKKKKKIENAIFKFKHQFYFLSQYEVFRTWAQIPE